MELFKLPIDAIRSVRKLEVVNKFHKNALARLIKHAKLEDIYIRNCYSLTHDDLLKINQPLKSFTTIDCAYISSKTILHILNLSASIITNIDSDDRILSKITDQMTGLLLTCRNLKSVTLYFLLLDLTFILALLSKFKNITFLDI